MCEGCNKVPMTFAAHRTFVANGSVAWLVSFLEFLHIEGSGRFEDVENAIMKSRFEAHSYLSRKDAACSES